MSNKFSENVKRIIGEKRDNASGFVLEDIGGIPSVRGIGTQTPGGRITSSTGSSEDSGKKNEDGKEDKTTEEESKESTTPNPDDQNSLQKNPTAGEVDADKLIDGDDGPGTKDAALDMFAGDSFANSSLSGINAIDCDTGKNLNIRVDGLYKPLKATTWEDGTIRTPAWDDPNVPPDSPGFTLGKYWANTTISVPYQESTPFDMDAISASIVGQNLGAAGQTGGPGTQYGPNTVGNYYKFTEYNAASATQYEVRMVQTDAGGTPIGTEFTAFTIDETSCTPGSQPYCPSVAPKETMWPEDNTISLTLIDGVFTSNQYDGDATVKYSGQESSHINFCMNGGRFGVIRLGKDGGTVVYETTSENGPPKPGTIVRYYGSDGSVAGYSDVAGINTFLPNEGD